MHHKFHYDLGYHPFSKGLSMSQHSHQPQTLTTIKTLELTFSIMENANAYIKVKPSTLNQNMNYQSHMSKLYWPLSCESQQCKLVIKYCIGHILSFPKFE